jgi:phosphoglycolate phosphatase-like HAD superfamily hydrolase
MPPYRGLISSDWSECLSPNGPFDFMAYVYPDLGPDLSVIFKQYTANEIALSEAMQRCQKRLPAPIRVEQMDAYLDEHFTHYSGVPELMEACRSRNILFMINTTGSRGYFQRVFSKKLLPRISALSANPGLCFTASKNDPTARFDLHEIADKPINTERAAAHFEIAPDKIIVMGDSGGDGPHFKWAAEKQAVRVASMAKPSLKSYCNAQQIKIDRFFGLSYEAGEDRREADEMRVDFRELLSFFEDCL